MAAANAAPHFDLHYKIDNQETANQVVGWVFTLDPKKPKTCALHPNSWKFIVGGMILVAFVFPLIGVLALLGKIGH